MKVIIETCLLSDEEKIRMCEVVTKAGADYIKTSTGFSKAGATFEDIKLFSEHIGENVKMKAAGGISSLDDAEKFLSWVPIASEPAVLSNWSNRKRQPDINVQIECHYNAVFQGKGVCKL